MRLGKLAEKLAVNALALAFWEVHGVPLVEAHAEGLGLGPVAVRAVVYTLTGLILYVVNHDILRGAGK